MMEFSNLQNSIYQDQLTGLPNFFKFIESDFENMFLDKGVIIIFDIAYFMIFKKDYGRENGDLCLNTLAKVINSAFLTINNKFIFRTHGDEFSIIVPNAVASEIELITDIVKKEFKFTMEGYGFHDVDIHILIIDYNEKICSIENYYELLIKNESVKHPEDIENKLNGYSIKKHILSDIINRVRETLVYYNNAQFYALVDDVSGIQNHRAGRMYLTNLITEVKNKSEIGLLFIDGDNLKRYNSISYQAGNEMIRSLSRIISNTLREEDKVYRWLSGDEFLVVIRDTNEANILKLAERIRQSVEYETKNHTYPVTISIGVSFYPKHGCVIDEIINKAEAANSIAKTSGKNKIVVWNNDLSKQTSSQI